MDSATAALIAALTLAATDNDEKLSEYIDNRMDSAEARQLSDFGKNATLFSMVAYGIDTPIELGVQVFANEFRTKMVSKLQRGTNRDRPDGTYNSFPSGHASAAAFQGISAISNGAPAWTQYGLIGLTMFGRVAGNRHYATDVLVSYGLSSYFAQNLNGSLSLETTDNSFMIGWSWDI